MRVAVLSRAVKKLNDRFEEVKGELNDLHNDDENNRVRVAQLRRALIAPNVVKVVETRIGTGNQDTTVTAVAYCAPASLGSEKARAVVSPTVFGETVPPA